MISMVINGIPERSTFAKLKNTSALNPQKCNLQSYVSVLESKQCTYHMLRSSCKDASKERVVNIGTVYFNGCLYRKTTQCIS